MTSLALVAVSLLAATPSPAGTTAGLPPLPAGFRWRVVTRTADVTLDGRPDVVLVGKGAAATALAVVAGPAGPKARAFVLELRHEAAAQDALCGTPATVTVELEELGLPLEEWGCTPGAEGDDAEACAGLRALDARLVRAGQKGSRGLRLSGGECDAFHVYFDGGALRWWRR